MVVIELSNSPLVSLISGDNGEQLWSRSLATNSLDSAGGFIALGGPDRTYLLNLDGVPQWDAPIAEGHTDAGATVLVGDSGDVVRWEKLGKQYVLQAYDGADGSPTWSVETSGAISPSGARLTYSGDLVVASLEYRGKLQVAEYVLPQTTPYRRTASGVFAVNRSGMVLWARKILMDSDTIGPGKDGEVLVAGDSFHTDNIDGYKLGKNKGVMMSLDTNSGKTNSVLSFFAPIRVLTSDQEGRSYLSLSGSYSHGFIAGIKQ